MSKIRGDSNPADLMTKYLVEADIVRKAGFLSVGIRASAGGDSREVADEGGCRKALPQLLSASFC